MDKLPCMNQKIGRCNTCINCLEQAGKINNMRFEAVGMLTAINAPYAKDSVSTLGGRERASLYIVISLDKPIEWANGILENSRYARYSLDQNGNLEHFSGHGMPHMRKTKVKTHREAIDKINKHIEKSLTL